MSLRVDDLTCQRGGRLIFSHLNFALDRGNAIQLIGSNGTGKSSLLRLLAGLLPPYCGQIFWLGRNIQQDLLGFRYELRFIGHLDAIKPVLTPRALLHFWVAPYGVGIEAIEHALIRLGLATVANWPARLLSAGQRRRLALARLVASPGQLWLLDEPTVGLDQSGLTLLAVLLAEHRAAGGLVILSTHIEITLPDAESIDLTQVNRSVYDDWWLQ